MSDSTHDLYSMDPTTMAVTDIGNMGVTGDFGDLAYDSANQTMYYSGGRGDENLYTVDLTTGAATLVGADDETDMFALGYDPATGLLYGGTAGHDFGTVDATTGAFTEIAPNDIYNEGLTFNSATGQFVLSDGGSLYSVDVSTGAATLLGSPTDFNDNGLAFDPVHNVYWIYGYSDQLFEIDPTTYSVINTFAPGYDAVSSLAYVPSSTPEPATMAVLGLGFAGLLRRKAKRSR